MVVLNDAILALGVKNFSVHPDNITEESFNETYREFNVKGEVSMELGKPTVTWSEVKAKYDELVEEDKKIKYQRDRKLEYPEIGDQLDMLFHAIDAGALDKNSDFYTTLKAVKDKYPKG